MTRSLALVLLLAAALGSPRAGSAQSTPPGPLSVVEAFDGALNRHDVEAAVALFADDAVYAVVGSGERYVGRGQIREQIQRLVDLNAYLETEGPRQASGERVQWVARIFLDDFRNLGVAPVIAPAEAVVRDGRIASFQPELTSDSRSGIGSALAVQAIMIRFDAAANAGDLSALVGLFSDDLVVVDRGERFNGRPDVVRWAVRAAAEHTGSQLFGSRQVAADRGTWLSNLRSDPLGELGLETLTVQNTMYVRDGRVISYERSFTESSARVLRAATTS